MMARYPDRITSAEKKALEFIASDDVMERLLEINEQGKMEILKQNLQTIITAAKKGMDVEKFNALLHQGAYTGEPGKMEDLIAQCM